MLINSGPSIPHKLACLTSLQAVCVLCAAYNRIVSSVNGLVSSGGVAVTEFTCQRSGDRKLPSLSKNTLWVLMRNDVHMLHILAALMPPSRTASMALGLASIFKTSEVS